MPNISKRGANTYASPIRKLSSFADKAKAAGKHVYHLNIGQPDIATPKIALETIKNLDLTVVEYAPAEGIRSYREALVDYYQSHQISVTADQILITTGASEAILFSMLSCMDTGDEIIIPEPFYAIYNGFSQMSNLTIVPITSYLETGFKLPEVAEFEAVITKKTKAIFICNPNNPTGCLYSKENLIALAHLAKKHDLFLFVDEVYREFCYDGGEFFSALNIPDMSENVVIMDSISKRFSACGARVGALVTRNQEVLDTVVRFSRLRLSSPTLGQILAEATLLEPPIYMEMASAEYDLRRKTVYERLSKMEGVDCYLPGGAVYCFARLPIADADHFCQWLLEDFDYQNKTVMLAPGGGFYATPGLGNDEVRIAYVLNVKDLNGAMDCLEEGLKVYAKTKMRVSVEVEMV